MLADVVPVVCVRGMIASLAVVARRLRSRRSAVVSSSRCMSTTTRPNVDSSGSSAAGTFCLVDYDVVGFDLDNTLARYRLPALFELIHRSVGDYLSTSAGHQRPGNRLWASARAFSQRGLLVDKKRGLLVKFDASGRVDRALKGFKRLSDSEASLEPLWHDLLEGIIHFYRPSGPRATTLLRTPDVLVRPCPPSVKAWIQSLRVAGTRTFLLTGSEPLLAFAIASHALGPQWRDLFDLVIVGANKPAFFSNASLTFQVVEEDGSERPLGHGEQLCAGIVYRGGNWMALCERWLGGHRALYVGDSLVDDIVASQGCCESVAILEELAVEAAAPEFAVHDGIEYLLSDVWGSVFASAHGPSYLTKAVCGAAKLAVPDVVHLAKLTQSTRIPAFDGTVGLSGFYPRPPESLVALLARSSVEESRRH
ncbi:5'-nucleotidase domain-containing protein 1 isoform X2 [Dermacentor andersoni]|uniref:5'-nucleotidase domain-containing protein 1 isoform X2 n=1 Tax=Dermacentor andersoni TaxID=34620 RepID=UPI0024172103|nr:5'-nucleotidase domain-containing protein 1-like isoform X2 [Dermacentor andersoni]